MFLLQKQQIRHFSFRKRTENSRKNSFAHTKKKIISWNILTQYGQNFVDTKHFKNKKKSKQRDMLDT